MLRSLRRFRADIAGVAAIEFAFIAPILVTMYFGVAELTQAMIAQRRTSHAASTIGDLVAQSTCVTDANVNDIFTVGQTILAPFPSGPLKMRITSISANGAGATTVDWSTGSGMSALGVGSAITVPSGVIAANQSVVKAEVSYTYTSPVNYVLPSPVTFTNAYYLRPRLSDKTTRQSTTCS